MRRRRQPHAAADVAKIILFIFSRTQYFQLKWGTSQNEMEKQHVLFMKDD
jgi:hypothetical protein